MAVLAAVLLGYAFCQLPETRPKQVSTNSFLSTLVRMLKDDDIWISALLVALFNICMFSYYQLAPFLFSTLGLPAKWFGYTGLVLAAGVGVGATLNKLLISKNWQFPSQLTLACTLSLSGAILVALFERTVWFVLPMILVVMAYGIAIPNILARALRHYKECMGTAGAILGLMYYLMLGCGLILVGLSQNLGIVLTLSSLFLLLLALRITYYTRRSLLLESENSYTRST